MATTITVESLLEATDAEAVDALLQLHGPEVVARLSMALIAKARRLSPTAFDPELLDVKSIEKAIAPTSQQTSDDFRAAIGAREQPVPEASAFTSAMRKSRSTSPARYSIRRS